MIKFNINNIPVSIFDNGIEYSEKGIYDAEYTFLIEDKNNRITEFKTIKTFCKKVPILPEINLKQDKKIKSVQVRLIKYLSDSFV